MQYSAQRLRGKPFLYDDVLAKAEIVFHSLRLAALESKPPRFLAVIVLASVQDYLDIWVVCERAGEMLPDIITAPRDDDEMASVLR